MQKISLRAAAAGEDAYRRRAAMTPGHTGGGSCFDFQKGRCTRGASCRFSHDKGDGLHSDRPDRITDEEPIPELYSIHRGRVKSMQSYGCFVEIPGFRKHGLVHISQMADRRVEECSDVLGKNAENTQVWVKVVSLENNKIALSLKDVAQASGNDLDPFHANARALSKGPSVGGSGRGGGDRDSPEEFAVLQGTVSKIMPFGAFVSLPGFRKHGLVHISQMKEYKVESVSDVVDAEQTVWVKVLRSDEDGKLSLSMKLVDQDTGRDLDPRHERAAEGGTMTYDYAQL
jgi:predicted RNA-binding protein with RPS1 domain